MEHKNQVILIITVELDNDDIDVIEVHENDEPDTLAINFCKKHNIDRKTQKFLIDKIVENIEELVEDKIKELSHQNQAPVHQRLYQQAVQKQQEEFQSVLSKQRKRKSMQGFKLGEKLYTKGIKQLELKEKRCELARQSQKDTENLTFKPRINPNSKIIAQRQFFKQDQENRKIFNSIKIQELQSLSQQDDECTFKPIINSSNVQESQQSTDRFRLLYEDAVERREKHQKEIEIQQVQLGHSSNYTFQPQLVSQQSFRGSIQRNQSKCQEASKEEFLFRPQTGRGPKNQNRNGAVWDLLYSQRDQRKSKSVLRPVKQLETSEQSNKIYDNMKAQKYWCLFDKLGPNGNGKLTASRIKYSNISQKTLKIINPLLQELEELGETLDFEEFILSMEKLMKTLSQAEKAHLLYNRRKISTNQQPIRQRSASVKKFQLYDRAVQQKKASQQKIEQKRNIRKQQELEQCTFKPQIKQFDRRAINLPPNINQTFYL